MSNPKQKDRRMWALKQRAEDAKTLELYIYGDDPERDQRQRLPGRSGGASGGDGDRRLHQQLRRQCI